MASILPLLGQIDRLTDYLDKYVYIYIDQMIESKNRRLLVGHGRIYIAYEKP
jgi:hypothetical protein